jgi:putative DNA primase/helicase
MMNGSDRRGDLLSSTSLTPASRAPLVHNHRAEYAAGMATCLRIIRSQKEAAPEKKRRVFQNQAAEVATYVKAGGLDKIAAVDSLANAAESVGIDPDTATAIMSEAIQRAEARRPERKQTIVSADRARRTLVTCNLSEVTPERIEWLWPGRVAVGKLTMIAGEPGLGKSQVALYVASVLSVGGIWTDRHERVQLCRVIILCAEDGLSDTIRPRVDAAAGDPSRITVIRAVETKGDGGVTRASFNLAADLALLEQEIKRCGDVGLVVIDPISSYMGKIDSHKNTDVRGVLEPIGEMAERLRVAVLAITHLNKSDGKAINRFIGSIAFIAAARAAFTVVKDPDDETGARRLLLQVKNNIAAPQPGLAFRLEQREVAAGVIGSSVAWDDSALITWTADQALNSGGQNVEQTAKDDAVEFLRDVLADGAVDVLDIEAEARAATMLSDNRRLKESKPFRDAAKALCIIKKRVGFGPGARVSWSLPTTPTTA